MRKVVRNRSARVHTKRSQFGTMVTVSVTIDRSDLDAEIRRQIPDAPLSASEERMVVWSAAQTLLERGRFCNMAVPNYTDDTLPPGTEDAIAEAVRKGNSFAHIGERFGISAMAASLMMRRRGMWQAFDVNRPDVEALLAGPRRQGGERRLYPVPLADDDTVLGSSPPWRASGGTTVRCL